MSKIISIGTAVPEYRHSQTEILQFMQNVYALNDADRRKLKFLYAHGGIETRYSVIPDYSRPASGWEFYPPAENLDPFPDLEKRMEYFNRYAGELSVSAVKDCMKDHDLSSITHLITVSCTGMSAPGLDLELIEKLSLPLTTQRFTINFMGCYAAVQALKAANAFCLADHGAKVLIVCTELCTLHFQKTYSIDNITSSMLFGDGSAAVLVSGGEKEEGLSIQSFYTTVSPKGNKDMAWNLSSHGFQMTLSSYVADLIKEDFAGLIKNALEHAGIYREDINHWCIHPGGKKILEVVEESLGFNKGQLENCYGVLREYGNMSSATVLFVLKKLLPQIKPGNKILGAAFGPGLTTETFILSA